jgi:hypothetical protein
LLELAGDGDVDVDVDVDHGCGNVRRSEIVGCVKMLGGAGGSYAGDGFAAADMKQEALRTPPTLASCGGLIEEGDKTVRRRDQERKEDVWTARGAAVDMQQLEIARGGPRRAGNMRVWSKYITANEHRLGSGPGPGASFIYRWEHLGGDMLVETGLMRRRR